MFVGWNFCPYRAYIADIVTALLTFDLMTQKLIRSSSGLDQLMCEVSSLYVKRKWDYLAETGTKFKSEFDLDVWTSKSIEVLLGSWSTHVLSIITLCQKVMDPSCHGEIMQTSKYKFDLDLWLFDPKIYGGLALVMGHKCMTYHYCMSKGNGVLVQKSFLRIQTDRQKVKVKPVSPHQKKTSFVWAAVLT